MDTSLLARLALIAPLPSVALEPLTATAYFRTGDHDSESPAWVRAWSGPLQDALPGAFTWASPDTVYLTYGKAFTLAFLGFLCAMVAVRRLDPATSGGRLRWAWPVVLGAYGLVTLGVIGEYWTPWTDPAFYTVTVPGLLLLMTTSPFLAARMLKQRVGSRAGAWMLALTLPAFVCLTALGGHLGFPVIWLAVAWMLHARAVLAQGQLSPPPAPRTSSRPPQPAAPAR